MGSGNKGIVAIGMVLLDGIGSVESPIAAWLDGLASPAHVDAGRMATLRERLAAEHARVAWREGGAVSNLAMAARAIGTPIEVWGSVGKDADGDWIEAALRRVGASPHLLRQELPTGVFCSLSRADGTRRVIVSQGAARGILGAALPETAFRSGWALALDGLLVGEPEWMGTLAARARAAGMIVAMDLSTQGNVAASGGELLRFAERYCDIVFANEAEYAIIKAAGGPSPNAVAAWVLKRGDRGAALLRRGVLIETEASEKLELVNDIGAGDAFAAGFLTARLAGLEDRECLRRGNASAVDALKRTLPNAKEFLRL